MKTIPKTSENYSDKKPTNRIYSDDDLFVHFRHIKPSSVSRTIRSQYDRLSTLEGFHTDSRFVLDLYPGLISTLEFSDLRCYYVDVIEPMGDRLIKYQGCSLAKQMLGRSDFCYHTLLDNFRDLPELFYDKIICSEVHKLRGSPLIEQAIRSLAIGGRIFVYGGLVVVPENLIRVACSKSEIFPEEPENFVEYLKIRSI